MRRKTQRSLSYKTLLIFFLIGAGIWLFVYFVGQRSTSFSTVTKANFGTRLDIKQGQVQRHPTRPGTYILIANGINYILQSSNPQDQGVSDFSQFVGKTVIVYGRLTSVGEPTLTVQRIVIIEPTVTTRSRLPCIPDPARKIQCPQPPTE